MQAGADLDPQPTQSVADAAGAADCPGGSVEPQEETVAGRIDFMPSKPVEFLAN
jgi:hypothetical protein